MPENRSSISKKKSYLEIGEYWDSHDLPEDSPKVDFTVELGPDVHYFAIENSLTSRLRAVAKKRGVSAESLINQWVEERIATETKLSLR